MMNETNLADQGHDQDDAAQYVIEITCLQDGTFTVQLESGAQEDAEEGGGEQDDDAGAQPAKTFADAMEIANQMYQQQGGGGADTAGEQSAAAAAFQTGRGK